MFRFALLAALITAALPVTGARAQAPIIPCPGGATETVSNPLFSALDDGTFEVSLAPVFTAAAPFRIAGTSFTTMFVNTNGNGTFGTGFTSFTPSAVPGLSQPTIAPFFADVDLRDRGAEVNPGTVRLCVDAAGNRVMVTWLDTVHYNSTVATTDFARRNTFQLILARGGLRDPGRDRRAPLRGARLVRGHGERRPAGRHLRGRDRGDDLLPGGGRRGLRRHGDRGAAPGVADRDGQPDDAHDDERGHARRVADRDQPDEHPELRQLGHRWKL